MSWDEQQLARRFAALTPASRRGFLTKLREAGLHFEALPIVSVTRPAVLPLSSTQHGLWLTWRMDPSSSAYNMPGALHLSGPLSQPCLQAALNALVQRHEVLRTVYPASEQGGEPEQQVLPWEAAQVILECVDLSDEPPGPARTEALHAQLNTWARQPFALDTEVPWRLRLWRLGAHQHVLGLNIHHVAADAGAITLLIDELCAVYAAACQGEELPCGEAERGGRVGRAQAWPISTRSLAPLPIQWVDYVLWQRNCWEAGAFDHQLTYWLTRLEGNPPLLALPLDRPRASSGDMAQEEGVYAWSWHAKLGQDLRHLAHAQGASSFMLMLALLQLMLYRYTGQTDLSVGSPLARRHRSDTRGLLACLTHMQVLRTRWDVSQSFVACLAAVRETVLEAHAHPDVPFDRLLAALKPERLPGVHPLFQVKLTQQAAWPTGLRMGHVAVEVEALSPGQAHFDLSLDFVEDADGGMGLSFSYAAALFDRQTIEGMAHTLSDLAEQVVRYADVPVRSLPVPTPASGMLSASMAPPEDVLDCWHRRVTQSPQSLAVRDASGALTRAELEQRAQALAHQLGRQGVGPETRVGVYAERSCAFVVGVLAVLKVGAAYVPLDPQWPTQRLLQLVADSGLRCVLSDRALPWHSQVAVIQVPLTAPACAEQTVEPYTPATPHPGHAAYLIYTSGSTGAPKGVVVSRAALSHYVQAVLARLDLPQTVHSLAMTSTVAADLGHTSLFGALCSGRTLQLMSAQEAFDPDQFGAQMVAQGIEVLKIVPSHLQALLSAADPAAVLPTHTLILGGEATPWSLLERIRQWRPQCRVFNHYGPTETTVGALMQSADTAWRCATVLPLGYPIGDVQAWVLDAQLCPVPRGAVGELYIGGAGLARGYWGQAGLTAERFVPSLAREGERWYRTGDRVRCLADGSLMFLGRQDDQVKIRGHRVELGEVAQALRRQAGVAQAEVVAHNDAQGRMHLQAYVVPTQGSVLQPEALRSALQNGLPEAMVPRAVMVLAALPVTLNGKIDRQALPDPDAVTPMQASCAHADHQAPRGPVEACLAEIWAEVLQRPHIGRHDNFFELGGDSILTLQIIARARQRGLQLSPKQLMQGQTIAAVSAGLAPVGQTPGDGGLSAELTTEQPGQGPLNLTPAQHWFLAQGFEAPWHWNQSVMLVPDRAMDWTVLQQAMAHVVAHHEALRWRFTRLSPHEAQAKGMAWQVAPALQSRGPESCLIRVDLAAHDAWSPQCLAPAITAVAEQAQRSLSPDLLFKAWYLDGGARADNRLLMVAHHLVVDGVSWRVILDDLHTAYTQLCEGLPVQLIPVGTALAQWSQHLQRYAQTKSVRAEWAYWQGVLTAHDPPLPGRAHGRNLVADERCVERRLSSGMSQRLRDAASQAYRTQIQDLLLTALTQTLCAWDGRSSVLLELEAHGREGMDDAVDLSRTVGWFTRWYPVRLHLAQGGAGDVIRAIKSQLRQVPDKGIGYGVLRYLTPEAPDAGLSVQPQVSFNYLGQLDASLAGGHWQWAQESVGLERSPRTARRVCLALGVRMMGGQLCMRWDYSAQQHDEASIQHLATQYQHALEALIAHCVEQAPSLTPCDVPLAALDQEQLNRLPLPGSEVDDLYPLSPLQAGLLFHSQYAEKGSPGAKAYVNQLRVDIEHLDLDRFQAAWQSLFERHAVLRTGFLVEGDVLDTVPPLQWVARRVQLPVRILNAQDRGGDQAFADAMAEEELARGFELSQPPLMRFLLIQQAANRYHLIWTRHHLLLDGWSTARLMAEYLQLYAGQTLAPPGPPFRDYIAGLQQRDAVADEAYWRARLGAVTEPTAMAQMYPARPQAKGSYHLHQQVWDAAETEQLHRFARTQHLTLNTLVQAAWALLLRSCGGPQAVCFGVTSAGRFALRPEFENTLGLFINTTPVVVDQPPHEAVIAGLHALQEQGLASREHEQTPLAHIQAWARASGVSCGEGQGLFDSILVFENYPLDEAVRQGSTDAQGLRFTVRASREETHYPVTVTVQPQGPHLVMEYGCQGQHISPSQAQHIAARMRHFLLALIDSRVRCWADIDPLTTDEYARVREWAHAPALPKDRRSVSDLIEERAHQQPQALALIGPRMQDRQVSTLSYETLNTQANRLAHHLRAQGVGPEVLVGVALMPSLERIVSLLAILKAGGAYLPLDPDYPEQRLRDMVVDSGVTLILTQQAVCTSTWTTEAEVTVLNLDTWCGIAHQPETPPRCEVPGEALAYVIYTSGSTGRPKGVGVTHAALAQQSRVAVGYLGLTPADRMLQFSTLNFDAFVEQVFPPLVAGAAVVLRGHTLWDSAQFYRALHEQSISIADLPTAYWHTLVQDFAQDGVRDYGVLRQVQASGEAMPVDGLQTWRQAGLSHVKLLNTYGPTETVVTASAQDCEAWMHSTKQSLAAGCVPIGQPLAGREVHILDEQLRPVAPHVPGELYIGGDLLARAYWRRPALSAERFIADPFSRAGGRLYRTGDIVCWQGASDSPATSASVHLAYLGRVDEQVKLRGFRIEPGEIETQLRAQEGVREAVVLALPKGSDRALVAYVSGEAVLQPHALRAALARALPDYMVPSLVVVLDRLPQNANGKIDKAALPTPVWHLEREVFDPPQGDCETALARIWSEVLDVDVGRIGRQDHFFDLGGHSLAAMQVRARIEQNLMVQPSLDTLFKYPCLADLASCLQAKSAHSSRLSGSAAQDLAHMSEWLSDLNTQEG